MSGGHFEYKDRNLMWEIFPDDVPTNEFEDREISELVWDVLNLIHDFDWYKCGDTGKETYLEAKAKFKKKWFSNRGVRVRRIVDDAVKELKDELYETFDVEKRRWSDGSEIYRQFAEKSGGVYQLQC